MMKKTVFTKLLAAVLLVAALTVGACAEETAAVMTVDGTEYTDFEEGWNAALLATANSENIVEVKLLADWTAKNGSFGTGNGFKDGAIYISEYTQGLRLDLNGFTIDRGMFNWSHSDGKPTGNCMENGMVLYIEEGGTELFVTNGTIRGGANENNGGGIYVVESQVEITNMTFRSNRAHSGAGVENRYGETIIDNCQFLDNYASHSGGGLDISCGSACISNSLFENNRTGGSTPIVAWRGGGGAIHNYDGDNVEVSNCIFRSNSSSQQGGAIHNFSGSMRLDGCSFENNFAVLVPEEAEEGDTTAFGGAMLCNYNADTKISNCTFTGNHADTAGVAHMEGDVTMTNCVVENNSCSGTNGEGASAFFVDENCELRMTDCTIRNNTGTCALFLDAGTYDQAELWVDGLTTIIDNRNSAGGELNICLEEDPLWATSIFMKKNFDRASRIGVGVNGDDMLDECAVEDIPDGWSTEELAACFKVDEVFLNGNPCSYYLTRDGSALDFSNGNGKDSIHNSANWTGAIMGEGSFAMILSLLAVCVSGGTLVAFLVGKKKSR